MRRKIDKRVISELEDFCLGYMWAFAILSFVVNFISINIQFIVFFDKKIELDPFLKKYGSHIWVWAIIIFLISVICLAVNHWKRPFDLLRKRNDKIDEEEKVKLQAELKAEADKEKVKSQIWVNE